MSLISGGRIDLSALQSAQNVLTDFNFRLMMALKNVSVELKLYFYKWEPYEYPKPNRNMWRDPIWDLRYSAFSHLPLIYSTHHFSNIPPEGLDGRVKWGARKGDSIVTFTFLTNKGLLAVDFGSLPPEEWPTTLPPAETSAFVCVMLSNKSSGQSFRELWDRCSFPDVEDLETYAQIFETEAPTIKAWAMKFDLADFLFDSKPLITDIGSFLSDG
ncbi:MAG: hypothetical protein LBI10_00540 [Deltaproteobacteria bacterium]|jgi:hypothetical protein|nr:hypothetical protein [Deltaproteobacteria bacterium]